MLCRWCVVRHGWRREGNERQRERGGVGRVVEVLNSLKGPKMAQISTEMTTETRRKRKGCKRERERERERERGWENA